MIGKSCKELLIINFFIFYNIKYRAKNSKKNLSDEFIDFFVKYSKLEKLSEEQDFLLRCGLGLFQAYIEYLNKSEEKIKAAWNLKIKPFLLKQYPIQKSGIFNVNADVEFLMKEIDKINTPEKEISESDKSYIKSRLYDIRINTIYISSKHNMKYNKANTNINYNKTINNNKINTTNNFSNSKNNPSNKINNSNTTNNHLDNNTKNNEDKNNTKDVVSNKPFDLMKKELALNMKNMKLMKKNNQQKKNIVVSIEKEFDILDADKRRNNSKDEQNSRAITLAKPFDPYKYVQELDNDNNNDSQINKKKIMLIIPDKKQKKVKELSPNYVDEHETENTIKFKNKDLKMISIDFFLKNIITSDFLEKYINHLYYFSQQCFCFTQKEILFQKIINCYTYYKKLNSPFFHLKKIIYFLDLLIIEMYEYYHSVPLKEISQIKKFYHNLENDIKKKLGVSNKDKNSSIVDKFGEDGEKNKKVSYKINEKVKLMGQMLDRLKSNPNVKMEKGKLKEEPLSTANNLNNKNEKDKINIKNQDEREVLEEIKQIIPLFDHEHPNYNVILNLKKILNFYILKADLYDSKMKKKNKLFKKPIASQRTISQKYEKINKKNMCKNYFSIIDWNPKDVGEALIAISKRDLIKIERKELYKAIFLKKVKNKTCPNIMECITQFNKLTSFIIEEILSYDLPKERAKIIEGWIKVAEYLKIRKDHNDCVAIYSALKNYIITGLKLTMKELKTKTKNLIKEVSEFCSFEGNYKNLRIDMINCLDCNEFYVPYLGMLLRDISFYEANYEYLINGNLINIEKIEKVQNTIDKFFEFKNIPDIYNKNNEYPQELGFFNNLEILKEDDLDILANKLEPKFILKDIQQKKKRLTNIDKKYFSKSI